VRMIRPAAGKTVLCNIMTLKRLKARPDAAAAIDLRFAIVCADYNCEFTQPLLKAAKRELLAAGAKKENIFITHVPGSYEIPVAAAQLALSGKFDAIIALGVVFQGKTRHAEHILQATSFHLQQISIQTGVPVINQVLSPASEMDARKRVSAGKFNRGIEAARAAIQMAFTMKKLGDSR